MKLDVLWANIATVPSDALIYSTNARLTLTGGVGAALLARFGIRVQIDLHNHLPGTCRPSAAVGDIIECRIDGGPWRHVFHTIATDELYHTKPDVVRSILRGCPQRCVKAGHVHSITCSPLGAGYADLDVAAFATLGHETCRDFSESSIEGFTIVTNDPKGAEVLASTFRALDLK
jgi:O-acetyl-ADP-ribose deacetylase (regulator of RNase III)